MKSEPIESNPSQGPSSAQKTEPQPQQESQFDRSLVTLEYSIGLLNEAIRNSPIKPGDSNYGKVVDQQILLQASSAISHLKLVLENERLEISVFKNTNSNLVRAINLLERTRSRINRGELSSARLALRQLELQNKEQRAKPERDEATAFLQGELAGGQRPAKDIIKTAKDLGISLKTLKRAKADLGITSRLDCTSQRTWYWSLPIAIDQGTSDLPAPDSVQISEPSPVAASAPSPRAASSVVAHPVSPDPIHFAASPSSLSTQHSELNTCSPTPISSSKSKGGHQ